MGGKPAGDLYLVSTPIGNLEDITYRAVRVLGSVDVIAAEDTRKTGFLLHHLGIRRELVSYHSYNESKRVPELIRRLLHGESVAVVTDAGTPGISDPAFSIIRGALDAGIHVIPIPGPTAFLPALVVSGLPTDRFVFEGFLPVKKGRRGRLERLSGEKRTMVLYESPHRIDRTLRELLEVLGDRQAALAREITKKFEETTRGTLSEILSHVRVKKPRGELVLVIAGLREDRPDSPGLNHGL
jgi:16S rRNA (cytidine1402-2'-O)-methyltransferase